MKIILNDSPLRQLWFAVIFAASLSVSGNTIADTIITGQLTYDSESSVITSSTGNSYLGFEIADGYNYDYVLNTILIDPLYSAYHVATQTEAYEFYNLAIAPITPVIDTEEDQTITTDVVGIRDRFGPSAFRDYRYGPFAPAFFLSDVGDANVGVIQSHEGSIVIADFWGGLNSTYYHSYGNGHADLYSWLLVKPNKIFTDGLEN